MKHYIINIIQYFLLIGAIIIGIEVIYWYPGEPDIITLLFKFFVVIATLTLILKLVKDVE